MAKETTGTNYKTKCCWCMEIDYEDYMYNTEQGYLCEHCKEDLIYSNDNL